MPEVDLKHDPSAQRISRQRFSALAHDGHGRLSAFELLLPCTVCGLSPNAVSRCAGSVSAPVQSGMRASTRRSPTGQMYVLCVFVSLDVRCASQSFLPLSQHDSAITLCGALRSNAGFCREPQDGRGDRREAARKVSPIPAIDRRGETRFLQLHAVAVEFQLIQPTFADRRGCFELWQSRRDELNA